MSLAPSDPAQGAYVSFWGSPTSCQEPGVECVGGAGAGVTMTAALHLLVWGGPEKSPGTALGIFLSEHMIYTRKNILNAKGCCSDRWGVQLDAFFSPLITMRIRLSER